MEQFKAWWNEASMRDQLALVALGVCFIFFSLFQFVYEPVAKMRAAQENRVQSQNAAYGRVSELANQWKAHLNGGGKGEQSAGAERIVQSSFVKHDLRVSGFDASGRSGIRVRFESIKYEKLLGWLHDMEDGQGLILKDVSVAGTSTSGIVSASVLIGK